MMRRSIMQVIFKTAAVTTAVSMGLLTSDTAAANDAQQLQSSYRLEAARKFVTALAALDKVSAKGKQSYIFKLRQGWLLHLNGRYAESIRAYRLAVKAAPRSVEARLGLTLPQMALRRFKDAADTAHGALKLDADNYTAKSRLAYCTYNLGRYAESMRHYKRLLELYPSDVEMRVGLGWAQLKLGKKDQAARTFNQALAISPHHNMAAQGLALSK